MFGFIFFTFSRSVREKEKKKMGGCLALLQGSGTFYFGAGNFDEDFDKNEKLQCSKNT